ncbi:hypothetical protein K378_01619 [Streptomyces sp. Amel2xB2]|uniref:Uncharacterized protein n=1 Tax=Streptomyces nanshensis TaxID=518642 RepID=A0A1E7L9Y7_9ACTN|nr:MULTISPECIES: hypothetical protein [Streptomyces]OEV12803.1 hypothetical protein AN218_06170 [Streptomyces nanshensis]RAJ68732.1 hypothetical protein K378_01619 [Streptomyces sp. Amel2xB2]
MHGGLPFIGVSVLVYGIVGAVVIAREAARRCLGLRPAGRRRLVRPVVAGAGGTGAARTAAAAVVSGQGVGTWRPTSR